MASPGQPRYDTSRDGLVAASVFGDRLDLAVRYAQRLSGDGVAHGLLGPRESERLWDRHLINCAAISVLIPDGARVVDVGSGAGLPGLALAIRRPDLRLDLVEPLARRVSFLDATVADLGLTGQVRVLRGRAEEPAILAAVGSSQWVTARAVAPLGRLVRWCLPLLARGGRLLALKGSSAVAELAASGPVIAAAGGCDAHVVECVAAPEVEPTTVIVMTRSAGTTKGRR